MSLPFSRPEFTDPTDPINAAQVEPVVNELRALTKLAAGAWPADSGVKFLLQFDSDLAESKNDAQPILQQPIRVVKGRTFKAARIERSGSNLLLNPSFEVDTVSWSTPDRAATIARGTTYKYTADKTVSNAALRIIGQDLPSSPYAAHSVTVETNQKYSASAYVYSPGVSVKAKIEVSFSGGTPASANSGYVTIPADTWTRAAVHGADSGNNTTCEVRIYLDQAAPTYATSSRVSSWAPFASALATSTSTALTAGDVVLAAVTANPSSSGDYGFFMVTTGGTGPADTALRLNGAAAAPTFATGSRVSIYRPAGGDAVLTSDAALALNAGDLVFCQLSGQDYGFAMVTTGATGASSTSLRLNGDGSPPDFDGTRLTRFVPAGTALVTSSSLALSAGAIAFCHLTSVGRYSFVPVTTGGTGPADAALRIADGTTAPAFATGSRLSYLTPTQTALATDVSITLNAGDALLAHTTKAPTNSGYAFTMVTTGGTGPAAAAIRLNDGPTLDELWVDCVQLEKSRFASSYIDHLQGIGYSGAANAVTNRSSGSLNYPVPTGISATAGSIGFWFKPNFNGADNDAHVLFDMAEAEFKNRMVIKKDVANNLVFAVYDANGGLKQIASNAPVSWSAGDWVHIGATWSTGTLQLFLNGSLLATTSSGSGTGSVGTIPSRMYVGSSFSGIDQADGLMTDLFMKSDVMTAPQVSEIASSSGEYLGITAVAASKAYVDAELANKVAKAGDTMSGNLAMGNNKVTGLGTPSASGDAATKGYVDTEVANKVAKAGDTMSGNLAMGNNKVTGLGSPSASTDAATKGYVDTHAQLPSTGEKSALVGTEGTPGTTNRYVTESDRTVRRDAMKFVDDFITNKDARWTLAGTGGTYTQNSELGGTGTLATGATTGNAARLSFNGVKCTDKTKSPLLLTRAKLSSTSQVGVGLAVLYGDDNNLVEIFYNPAAGANFKYRCVNAGTATVVDSGVAADTAYHTFSVNARSSDAIFSIDGANVQSINTNLPTALLEPRVALSTTENADKQLTVDFVYLEANR